MDTMTQHYSTIIHNFGIVVLVCIVPSPRIFPSTKELLANIAPVLSTHFLCIRYPFCETLINTPYHGVRMKWIVVAHSNITLRTPFACQVPLVVVLVAIRATSKQKHPLCRRPALIPPHLLPTFVY